jgi:hypothetical protein
MHVHGNQVNPYAQLDALYAAEKAAAKKEAARTRKKLSDFASKLAGEAGAEGGIVEVKASEESQERTNGQNQQGQGGGKRQKEPTGAEPAARTISDWA